MNFDYVIYPANISGIIIAKLLSKKGKVLLLNRFGFMGGDITSALNLIQLKPSQAYSMASKIINSISMNEFLFQNEVSAVINPEYYKIALQEFIEQEKVEFLFHIRPLKLIFNKDLFELEVIAKEGVLKFSTKKLYDLSETQELTNLIYRDSRSFKNQYINFITTKLIEENILQSFNINQIQKLDDGRYFFSIKLNSDKLDEIEAQEIFISISKILWHEKARIQLLPAESLILYDFANKKIDCGFFNYSSFDIQNKSNERIISAELIEEQIG